MMNPEEVIRQYVSDTVSFATATYQYLQKNVDANFVSSPFSMETLLILLRIGARGATAHEIITKLRQNANQAKLEPAVKALISILTQGGFYTFFLANKIFVKKGCAIKEDFKKVTEEIFTSFVANIDFSDPEAAAKHINDWIKNYTMGHTTNVIQSEQLSPSSRVVLVNSLYVNTMWEFKFSKEVTYRTLFFPANEESVETEYMASRGRYRCFDLEKRAKMVEVKFLSDEGSMVIVLPNENERLSAIESMIETILNIPPSQFVDAHVKIEMPEFKISTTLDFKDVLEECGVRRIFQEGDADLTGIAEGGDLHVNTIIQKVLIKIDERGIETTKKAIGEWNNRTPFIPSEEPVVHFVVDRPFIFYIRLEDVVIFVGRVVNPNLPVADEKK